MRFEKLPRRCECRCRFGVRLAPDVIVCRNCSKRQNAAATAPKPPNMDPSPEPFD